MFRLEALERPVPHLICHAITSMKHNKIIQRRYPQFNPIIRFATRAAARTDDAIIAARFIAMKLNEGVRSFVLQLLQT